MTGNFFTSFATLPALVRQHTQLELDSLLHWLKVPERVKFRLCVLTYRCLNGTAPHYLAETIHPVTSRGTRQRLRSADTSTTCATHTPHKSWRSLISGGCRTSMEHSAATGSGCAFSSCLSTGTEDCAVPVVFSG